MVNWTWSIPTICIMSLVERRTLYQAGCVIRRIPFMEPNNGTKGSVRIVVRARRASAPVERGSDQGQLAQISSLLAHGPTLQVRRSRLWIRGQRPIAANRYVTSLRPGIQI